MLQTTWWRVQCVLGNVVVIIHGAYTTLIQVPLEISHTLTVLTMEHEAMYWLLDEKLKSVLGN